MAPTLSLLLPSLERFQSLKGFQRFCGLDKLVVQPKVQLVSIPKRVSEVLWLGRSFIHNLR